VKKDEHKHERDDIVIEDREIRYSDESIIASICRIKNNFVTNLGIAFLILTVIR